MWSGPRSLSTVLMRAFGSRLDTFVCDEPLYAHYLTVNTVDHPGRDAVIACHETDWRRVVAWLTGPVPHGRRVFYQKQMAHHLLPEIERGWLAELRNAFLIRDPEEMIASYGRVAGDPTLADLGLPQQRELFELVADARGSAPPVLDATDLLEDPEGRLRALCEALDLPFDRRMLRWKPGLRETDGVWAEHWYGSVEHSAGFQPYRPARRAVPDRLRGLLDEARGIYRSLHDHRL